MSDPTNIFNDSNNGNNLPNNDGSNVNANQDAELTTLLASIKNERGDPKYKTVKEAIIGLQNAQNYIPGLKDELKTMKEQLAAQAAKDEEMETLRKTVAELAGRTNNDGQPLSNVTPEQIAELVKTQLDSTLTAREQAAIHAANTRQVVDSLKAEFGNDAQKKFEEKAAEMGLTSAEFQSLAAKTPKMVLTALGVAAKAPAFNPTSSSINSSAHQPQEQTLVGRNKVPTLIGATSQELHNEAKASRAMVKELHSQGKTVHDLTDPKVYFKHFGQS